MSLLCDALSGASPARLDEALGAARTSTGQTLRELGHERALMLVFINQLACAQCQAALRLVAAHRERLEATSHGAAPLMVLVHACSADDARGPLTAVGLGDVPAISDPGAHLRRAVEASEPLKVLAEPLRAAGRAVTDFLGAVLWGQSPPSVRLPVYVVQDGRVTGVASIPPASPASPAVLGASGSAHREGPAGGASLPPPSSAAVS